MNKLYGLGALIAGFSVFSADAMMMKRNDRRIRQGENLRRVDNVQPRRPVMRNLMADFDKAEREALQKENRQYKGETLAPKNNG